MGTLNFNVFTYIHVYSCKMFLMFIIVHSFRYLWI